MVADLDIGGCRGVEILRVVVILVDEAGKAARRAFEVGVVGGQEAFDGVAGQVDLAALDLDQHIDRPARIEQHRSAAEPGLALGLVAALDQVPDIAVGLFILAGEADAARSDTGPDTMPNSRPPPSSNS